MVLDQPNLSGAGQVLLGTLVAIAAVYDIRFRRIPNWLVLAGIITGCIWNVYSSGFTGLGRSAAGLGLGFALYFPLYLIRARGAGDVVYYRGIRIAPIGGRRSPLSRLIRDALRARHEDKRDDATPA